MMRKKAELKQNKAKYFKKGFSKKIGVQRISLSRELAKTRDEGLIRFSLDYIELLKE